MSTPAGWYADPAPESAPGTVRWWDGQRWTEQVRSAPTSLVKTGAATPPQTDQRPVQQLGPQGQAPVGYQGPVAQAVPPVQLTHTPDGQLIASPWKRLGAQVIDSLLIFVVVIVLELVLLAIFAGGGALLFNLDDPQSTLAGAGLTAGIFVGILLFVVLVLGFQYWYFIHRVRKVGATFGKQVLGLRIRTFHTDGQLTWAQVWGRFGLISIGSSLTGGLLGLVDALWLFWDKHCQTLHDKTVGTIVVDGSVPPVPADHPGVQYARAFPAPRGWVADGPNPQTPATYLR